MVLKLPAAVFLGLAVAVPNSIEAQIRGFFPPSDSIYVGGSCFMPHIVCSVAEGTAFIDTVRIRTTEFSYVWYLDSTR
jgi:hypothetical protein